MTQDSECNLFDEGDEQLAMQLDALGRNARRLDPESIARIARISAASLPKRRASAPSSLRLFFATPAARYAMAAALIAAITLATAYLTTRKTATNDVFVAPRELAIEDSNDELLPMHVERALAREVSFEESSPARLSESALLQLASHDLEPTASVEPFGAVLASRAVRYDEFEAEMRDLAGEGSTF
ncbi:MAG: hypothetical protein EXS10_00415 [Phycisphaerales bacterium]|nr:hypothetical protein [Phycisphaerales bacterium]